MSFSLIILMGYGVIALFVCLGAYLIYRSLSTGLVMFENLGAFLMFGGVVLLFFQRGILINITNHVEVGVVEYKGLVGHNNIRITVPKEDKELVLSQEYSINELVVRYTDEYEGERYIHSDEAFIVSADTTISYQLNREDD